VAAFLAAVLSTSSVVATARASTCTETGIFWSDANTFGTFITAYGAYAQITLHSHTLSCSAVSSSGGPYSNGQTARILILGQTGHYAEVGYGEKWCSAGVSCTRAFYEYEIGGAVAYKQEYYYSCLNPNTRHAWEMIYTGGSWGGYLSCYTTGSWQLVDIYPDDAWSGYADNEGFQNSSTGTEGDLQETHSALQYMDQSGLWWSPTGSAYPGGVDCRRDTSSRWEGNWLSGDSFNFTTSYNGEGCAPSG
jgi:hypothetical protein